MSPSHKCAPASHSTTHPSRGVEQSPPKLHALCRGQGGAAQPVLVLHQSTRGFGRLLLRAEKEQRAEGVGTVVRDQSSWDCSREERRSVQSKGAALHRHGAAPVMGLRRERMEPRVSVPAGHRGKEAQHLCKREGGVLALSLAQLCCGQDSQQGKQFHFPVPSSSTRFWKHGQSSWHCCVPSRALPCASSVSACGRGANSAGS